MTDPQELWTQAWALLLRANADKKHPFTTPGLTSVDTPPLPRSRKIILRKADKATGEFRGYTDLRSAKVRQLEAHPHFGWLFWDPKKRVQFYGLGPTRWLEKEAADRIFQSLPKHSRKAYATLSAPGKPRDNATAGLPDNWGELTQEATDYARQNFGVFVTHLEEVEILQLGRERHYRMRATRTDGDWKMEWIVP